MSVINGIKEIRSYQQGVVILFNLCCFTHRDKICISHLPCIYARPRLSTPSSILHIYARPGLSTSILHCQTSSIKPLPLPTFSIYMLDLVYQHLPPFSIARPCLSTLPPFSIARPRLSTPSPFPHSPLLELVYQPPSSILHIYARPRLSTPSSFLHSPYICQTMFINPLPLPPFSIYMLDLVYQPPPPSSILHIYARPRLSTPFLHSPYICQTSFINPLPPFSIH